jgi:tungstate transport system ATP-binding protein
LDVPGAVLEVNDLQVERAEKVVLTVDHLDIQHGEVLAVIGPNGAGKSTLLLALSQLIKPTSGSFLYRGKPIDPNERVAFRKNIGLVLQEPLLLDTTVFENVAVGLRFRHVPNAEIKKRVNHWLDLLGISHLSNRISRKLSGGEAQRVSLARAFVLDPDILLLDEPFSALDAPTRVRLLEDFQVIIAATQITTIVVTHDLNEALLLGDRVAVLLGGMIHQLDSPQAVFNEPANPDVASFVGVETIIPGQVTACLEGLVKVKVDGYTLEAVGDCNVGRPVFLGVRPENITLHPVGDLPLSSARNAVRGRITRLMPQGPLVRVMLNCGFPLVALITNASLASMGLTKEQEVMASFKASAAHLIPR